MQSHEQPPAAVGGAATGTRRKVRRVRFADELKDDASSQRDEAAFQEAQRGAETPSLAAPPHCSSARAGAPPPPPVARRPPRVPPLALPPRPPPPAAATATSGPATGSVPLAPRGSRLIGAAVPPPQRHQGRSPSPRPPPPSPSLLDVLRHLDLYGWPHPRPDLHRHLGHKAACSLRVTCREARLRMDNLMTGAWLDAPPAAAAQPRPTAASAAAAAIVYSEAADEVHKYQTLASKADVVQDPDRGLVVRAVQAAGLALAAARDAELLLRDVRAMRAACSWWMDGAWEARARAALGLLRGRWGCQTSRLVIRAEAGGSELLRPFAAVAAEGAQAVDAAANGGGSAGNLAACPRVLSLELYGAPALEFAPEPPAATGAAAAAAERPTAFARMRTAVLSPGYAAGIAALFPNLKALTLRGAWRHLPDAAQSPWYPLGLPSGHHYPIGEAWLLNLSHLARLRRLELPPGLFPGAAVSLLAALSYLQHLTLTLPAAAAAAAARTPTAAAAGSGAATGTTAMRGGGGGGDTYGTLLAGLPSLVQLRSLVLAGGAERPSRELLAALPRSLERLRMEAAAPQLPPRGGDLSSDGWASGDGGVGGGREGRRPLAVAALAAAADMTWQYDFSVGRLRLGSCKSLAQLVLNWKPLDEHLATYDDARCTVPARGAAAAAAAAGIRRVVATVEVADLTLANDDGLDSLLDLLQSYDKYDTLKPYGVEARLGGNDSGGAVQRIQPQLQVVKVEVELDGKGAAAALRRLAATGFLHMQRLLLIGKPSGRSGGGSGGSGMATLLSLLQSLASDQAATAPAPPAPPAGGQRDERQGGGGGAGVGILPHSLWIRVFDVHDEGPSGGTARGGGGGGGGGPESLLLSALERWPPMERVVFNNRTILPPPPPPSPRLASPRFWTPREWGSAAAAPPPLPSQLPARRPLAGSPANPSEATAGAVAAATAAATVSKAEADVATAAVEASPKRPRVRQ
ncbi:hypothetical protein PLESTB_001509500 [Pleodorina starrii]|uniref:Uncharacterized protein n=1 Tax=Pleodorina starrii TaxID=330485 RepID=A0A9W6F8F5_9CHLO|nr:hypothetical protein PLESTB_001509500 [Pleodorina starrii]